MDSYQKIWKLKRRLLIRREYQAWMCILHFAPFFLQNETANLFPNFKRDLFFHFIRECASYGMGRGRMIGCKDEW